MYSNCEQVRAMPEGDAESGDGAAEALAQLKPEACAMMDLCYLTYHEACFPLVLTSVLPASLGLNLLARWARDGRVVSSVAVDENDVVCVLRSTGDGPRRMGRTVALEAEAWSAAAAQQDRSANRIAGVVGRG